jgi:putative addiction module component (TIGR02574 family)
MLASMGGQARKILSDALSLSLDERAELAAELLVSLDGEPDADAEQLWAAEITRRAERARAGETAGVDSDTVHAKARLISDPRDRA